MIGDMQTMEMRPVPSSIAVATARGVVDVGQLRIAVEGGGLIASYMGRFCEYRRKYQVKYVWPSTRVR